jgi:hypothetical protein
MSLMTLNFMQRLRGSAATPKLDIGQELGRLIYGKNIGGVEHTLSDNLDYDERCAMNDGKYNESVKNGLVSLLVSEGPSNAFWAVCDTLQAHFSKAEDVFKATLCAAPFELSNTQREALFSGMAATYLPEASAAYWNNLGKEFLIAGEARRDAQRVPKLVALAQAVGAVRPSAGEGLRAAPAYLLEDLGRKHHAAQRQQTLLLEIAPYQDIMAQVTPGTVLEIATKNCGQAALNSGRASIDSQIALAEILQALQPYPSLTQSLLTRSFAEGLTFVPAQALGAGASEAPAIIDPSFPVMIIHPDHTNGSRSSLPDYLNFAARDATTPGRADAVLPAVFEALATAALSKSNPEHCRILQAELKALGNYYTDLWREEVSDTADKRIAGSLKTVGITLPLSPI